MSRELVVSSTQHETKVAIREEDELVEIYFEREMQYGLAGSIYKGRVTRVLPGMQSAFVDIGLERDAFLYVSDFLEDHEEYDRIVTTVEDKVVKMEEKSTTAGTAGADAPPAAAGDVGEPIPPASPRGTSPTAPVKVSQREDAGGFRRDRRGRRGRRRPGVGRGFPESKYAAGFEGRAADHAPVFSAPSASPTGGEEFEVLPGESLARHNRPLTADQPAQAADLELGPREALLPVVPGAEAAPTEESNSEPESPTPVVLAKEPLPDPSETAPEPAEEVVAAAAAEFAATTQATAAVEPAPEIETQREASIRERPYGRRYLHRQAPRVRPPGGRFEQRSRPSPDRRAETSPRAPEESTPVGAGETSITDLLKEGQEILVQIAKEPIGKKGARITSHIALPGRYLVYMPTVDHIGVSRKIHSEEERLRLKRIVQTHGAGMAGGFIVRTAGDGQPEAEIRADMDFLSNLWLDIRQKAERNQAPALIHHDLGLVERILRDRLAESFQTIWVDSQEEYQRIVQFVGRFQPRLVNQVKLYTRSNPIFDEYGITPELEKALRPKVWLKSGGYIVINQTEALVAIDVNTGKYVGKSNRLEDTIVKTNIDAIQEIVRQIRLRDLGGIIVVDFIDMEERKNRYKVMQALEEALQKDHAPSKALQFNDFGLVAITRKRVKQSLERALCTHCPYCEGSGFVKSPFTMIQEILAEAVKIAPTLQARDVTLRVNPEVANALKARNTNYLEEVEAAVGRPVLVRSDPLLHQERFDFN